MNLAMEVLGPQTREDLRLRIRIQNWEPIVIVWIHIKRCEMQCIDERVHWAVAETRPYELPNNCQERNVFKI